MEAPITLKFKHGDDIRRFSVNKDISFEDLRARVSSSFRFANWPLLKYTDDEGDDISITCTDELAEAFRLVTEGGSGSRILHINVYQTKVPAQQQEQHVVVEEQKQYAPLPVSEWDAPAKETITPAKTPASPTVSLIKLSIKDDTIAKEYPKIPVEEWDAFVKSDKPAALIITKEPAEPAKPQSISVSTQRYCTDTTKDVAEYVKRTMDDMATVKTYSDGETLPAMCEKLRKECEQLCSANALLMGGLALSTLQQCQRLSEETAAMCQQLSHISKENEEERSGLKSQVSSLSAATKGDCDALSESTRDETVKTSNSIRAMIMGL